MITTGVTTPSQCDQEILAQIVNLNFCIDEVPVCLLMRHRSEALIKPAGN